MVGLERGGRFQADKVGRGHVSGKQTFGNGLASATDHTCANMFVKDLMGIYEVCNIAFQLWKSNWGVVRGTARVKYSRVGCI